MDFPQAPAPEESTAEPPLPEAPPLVPVPMVTPLQPQSQDTLPTENVTSSPAFDCEAGYNNWRDGWSEQKQAYCCQLMQRGCPDEEQEQTDGGEGDSYDCEVGISGWTTKWDARKRMWCCRHEGRGCAPMVDAGADGRAVSEVSATNASQGDTSNRRLREA